MIWEADFLLVNTFAAVVVLVRDEHKLISSFNLSDHLSALPRLGAFIVVHFWLTFIL